MRRGGAAPFFRRRDMVPGGARGSGVRVVVGGRPPARLALHRRLRHLPTRVRTGRGRTGALAHHPRRPDARGHAGYLSRLSGTTFKIHFSLF